MFCLKMNNIEAHFQFFFLNLLINTDIYHELSHYKKSRLMLECNTLSKIEQVKIKLVCKSCIFCYPILVFQYQLNFIKSI